MVLNGAEKSKEQFEQIVGGWAGDREYLSIACWVSYQYRMSFEN
jgi:hypothetical protein